MNWARNICTMHSKVKQSAREDVFCHQKLIWMSEYSYSPMQGTIFLRFFFKFFIPFLQYFHFYASYISAFYWRKELGQADLPDTLNMFIQSTENFLDALQRKFQLKTWGFVKIFQPDFELNFIKISTFFTFCDMQSVESVAWVRFFHWNKDLG